MATLAGPAGAGVIDEYRPPASALDRKLFAQDRFETEPDRAAEAGNDHGQHHLEGEAQCLLDALAPFPQVRD